MALTYEEKEAVYVAMIRTRVRERESEMAFRDSLDVLEDAGTILSQEEELWLGDHDGLDFVVFNAYSDSYFRCGNCGKLVLRKTGKKIYCSWNCQKIGPRRRRARRLKELKKATS
jgi:hypothetical protein